MAAFLFIALYCMMPLGEHATYPFRQVLENVVFFLLTAIASGKLSEILYREKESFRKTSDSYHGLTNALNLNIMNLQSKVDSLSDAYDRLEEVDRNKTRFISGVSHELRAPLSSIRSFSEILLNYNDIEQDTIKEFIGIINRESERLTQLVNEILDVVRIGSGKMEWHMEDVDLLSVIHTAVNTIAPLANDKGIPIELKIPASVPHIKGDGNRLLQVFLNLLSNAVKFTSRGKITVCVEDLEKDVKAYVEDTGEGIYPEEKDKIFGEFYRIGDNLSGRPKGSGLGLSISKNIVEAHLGRIWVESELGKGSTFYVVLPKEIRTAKVEEKVVYRAVAGQHILVLDDYKPVRQILRNALEGMGYKTLGAENISMAIEMSKARRPNAILLGYPSSNENFSHLLAFSRLHAVPIFLAAVINDAESGPQLAVNGYISKPFDSGQISSTLNNVLGEETGRAIIISNDPEEARDLQFMVGTRGFDTEVVADVHSMHPSYHPRVAIIGAMPKPDIYRTIDFLRSNSTTIHLPLLLTLNITIRDIKCIGIDSMSYGNGLKHLFSAMEAMTQRA